VVGVLSYETLNGKNCRRASPTSTCYSDQSLVAVGRLMRQTCLIGGSWDRSNITRLHRAAMR